MKKRYLYLDVMRIIAVFLVLFNHMPAYTLYQSTTGLKTWIYMIITMMTRINVPLFFMISGTLLLGREINYKTILSKKVCRFALVIIIFELGFYLERAFISFTYTGQFDINITNFITGMFAGSIEGTYSYWYLYAYLGMLLTLPFLTKICLNLRKQDFIFLLVMHFIMSSFLPMVNCIGLSTGIGVIDVSGNITVPLATVSQLFYPIIGYYVDRNIDVDKLSKKKILFLIIATFLGIMLSCVFTYYEGIQTGFTQNYVQLFDYLTTICAFILIKKICNNVIDEDKNPQIVKNITKVGSLTFGIYLLDPYLQVAMYSKFESALKPLLPTLLVSIGWCFFSMLIGGFFALILKKVPCFKKMI